jgi:hypothetical protein
MDTLPTQHWFKPQPPTQGKKGWIMGKERVFRTVVGSSGSLQEPTPTAKGSIIFEHLLCRDDNSSSKRKGNNDPNKASQTR